MKFNHQQLADRFIAIMDRAGACTRWSRAGTGTIYVTVDGDYKVRFADHGECYCREDISVDPAGCSLEQAVRRAADHCDLDVSRSLAAFKAAATKRQKERAAREAYFAPIEAAYKKREAERFEFQRGYIVKNYPDYGSRSARSQKRIRQAANKLFEANNA